LLPSSSWLLGKRESQRSQLSLRRVKESDDIGGGTEEEGEDAQETRGGG
jgi:hypothetical protein